MTSLTDTTEIPRRLVWLDCVKVIGMYLIIVGHMDVPGREFVYGVSVPVFFWASGYLEKDVSWPILLRKCLLNLFLPTLVLVLILKTIYFYQESLNESYVVYLGKNIACALLGKHGWYGIGMGWFVYTLICLKILRHICGLERLTWCLIPAGALAFIFFINRLFFTNAIANITVALPFYVVGEWCQKNKYVEKVGQYTFPVFLGFVAVYALGGFFNGVPWMFMNHFGRSYLLFILTGLVGICVLSWIGIKTASLLTRKPKLIITLLAEGGLLVLCTQHIFFGPFQKTAMAWIYGAVAYLSYIPIIWVCRKWMPFLLGAYGRFMSSEQRLNKASE